MEVQQGMSRVVLTVGPGHTLREVAQMMTERQVGAAIVLDEELPGPGIISERGILRSVGAGEDPDTELVRKHMLDSVISAAPDWSLERAAIEMSHRHVRHLVVVENGQPIGILSMRDIVRVWVEDGATSSVTPPTDEVATLG